MKIKPLTPAIGAVVSDILLGDAARDGALFADVKAALPAGTSLAVIPTVQRPTAACWIEGSDLAMLARAADALEIPAYQPTAEAVHLDAWDVRRRVGDAAPMSVVELVDSEHDL